MIRVAVTGKPGSGKSTICGKVVQGLKKQGMKVGGILSSEIRENNIRRGFSLANICTGEQGVLAHIKQLTGPNVGRYKVNLEDLSRIGVLALMDGLNCDVVVIDEIAPMELKSREFINAVQMILDSDKDMLVALHYGSRHKLAQRIRDEFQVLIVDENNRDTMAGEILDMLL